MSMNDNPSKSDIEIIWHGHSCFKIGSEEARIVIDPYDHVPGYGTLNLEANRAFG